MGWFCLMRYILDIFNKKLMRMCIITMIIAVLVPFINATGSRFVLYSTDVNLEKEIHIQYNHGFYSVVQFLKHGIIKKGHGMYGVWNDTVFMLPVSAGFYHISNSDKSIDFVKEDSLNQLSYTKAIHLNEDRTKGKIFLRSQQAVLEYNLSFQGYLGL